MKDDKKVSCTVLAILYVILSYASPFVWVRLAGEDADAIIFLILVIPLLYGNC